MEGLSSAAPVSSPVAANLACSDLLKTMAVMANRAEKKGKLRKESQAV